MDKVIHGIKCVDIAIDEIIEEPADVANAPTIDGTLRHWNLLKIQLFYRFTHEKRNIFSSSSYHWAISFVSLLTTDRKIVDSTPKYYLHAGDTNQVSNFSPCIRYK